MNDLGRRRLRTLLDDRDLEMKATSIAAGLGATYVRDILKKDRGGRAAELAKLAAYLNVALEYLMGDPQALNEPVKAQTVIGEPPIQVVGKVGAGIWFEVQPGLGPEGFADSMFPPDTRYPIEAQYDLEVSGSSLDKIARDGEFIRCLDYERAGLSPQNGDLVIVQRTRMDGSLNETTVKYFFRAEDHVELRPRSNDPRWQDPIIINGSLPDGETITVAAMVLYAYRPLGRD